MNSVLARRSHARRERAEKRFRAYGLMALGLAVLILAALFSSLVAKGHSGFIRTEIRLPIAYDADKLGVREGQSIRELPSSSFTMLAQESLKRMFPEVADERKERRQLLALVSLSSGVELKHLFAAEHDRKTLPQAVEVDIWVPAASIADLYVKSGMKESEKLTDQQKAWLKKLHDEGRIRKTFNSSFFSNADSRAPERAGFMGAILGSLFTLVVCLVGVFPIGVATAVYLEEFSRKSRWVEIIEVNINNLAAVPSIVFGLLGLAVYINVMGMPRSAPLVGGLTLALMVLPVIIIATRAALKSIPNTIRDAARALGASPVQVVWHHVLPLSMPGIMTGTILGMARAIGETAPLLMIGMVAFVADKPDGFTAPSTVMPVQIYLWAGSPEAGFAEKTAAGILTLLVLLIAMNALAIYLRKRFEVRW
jgi:phosphate transport system permease protein